LAQGRVELMLVVSKLHQINNQFGSKRRSTGKDKSKKNEAFSQVLDEKLQASAAKSAKN
jgi:hypothetical protein